MMIQIRAVSAAGISQTIKAIYQLHRPRAQTARFLLSLVVGLLLGWDSLGECIDLSHIGAG
ncbi:MAG: hypothetical protein H0X73_00940 [Chthoniobacterales bacterium]|nr:hypothetical protein [Chthoniobacterales bacterium]